MLALVALLFWAQTIDIQSADQAFNEGRFEEAAAQYRQFLDQMPNEPALLLRLGFCEYSMNNYTAAEQTFRNLLKLAPELPQAKVGLGSALIFLGRSQESIPLLEDAVRKLPGDPQAGRALGHAYLEVHDFIKAEDTLRSLVEENPDDAESWFYLGILLVNQNYSLPALEALEKALALRPGNPIALIYRAGALTQLGRLDEAEAEFAKLSRHEAVNESEEYYLGYAQLLFTKGDYQGALEKINAAIEKDPDSGKIRYWRARSLFYLGQEDAALEEAEKCVALAPDMPGGRNLLLRLYQRKGMKEKAAEQARWLRENEHRVAMGRGR